MDCRVKPGNDRDRFNLNGKCSNTKDSLRSHRQSFHFSFASKADANSTLEGLRAIGWKVPQTDPCTAAKTKRYSFPSSARPRSGIGTVRPSALAVLRLRNSSTLVVC